MACMRFLTQCSYVTFAAAATTFHVKEEQVCSASVSGAQVCHGSRQLFQRAVHRGTASEATAEASLEPPKDATALLTMHSSVSRQLPVKMKAGYRENETTITNYAPLKNATKGTDIAAFSSQTPANGTAAQMAAVLSKIPVLSWLPPSIFTSVLTAYAITAMFTALVICFLYWKSGIAVITRVLIYLAALSTMKLVVKNIYVTCHWEFPTLVTASHFFCGSVVAFSYLLWRRDKKPVHVPTAWEFCAVVFPISFGFAISVVASNIALYFCSAAFTEIIGATSPVLTALMLLVVGQPISSDAVGPVALVVLGCMISTSGEMNFSGIGFACCFISCLGRAVKATLQQMVMTGDLKQFYDPITLLAWMCVPSFVMMMGFSIAIEGWAPYKTLMESDKPWGIVFSVLLSCVNASILNLSNLFCTRDLGAIGLQLVGQMKGVLTVLGAVALFHESVTMMQILGYVGVICGVALFSRTNQPAAKSTSAPPAKT